MNEEVTGLSVAFSDVRIRTYIQILSWELFTWRFNRSHFDFIHDYCYCFAIERFFVLRKAAGTGNLENFVIKVRNLLDKNKIDEAVEECDAQKVL